MERQFRTINSPFFSFSIFIVKLFTQRLVFSVILGARQCLLPDRQIALSLWRLLLLEFCAMTSTSIKSIPNTGVAMTPGHTLRQYVCVLKATPSGGCASPLLDRRTAGVTLHKFYPDYRSDSL